MPDRWCTFTVTDDTDKRHSLDVLAASTYDTRPICMSRKRRRGPDRLRSCRSLRFSPCSKSWRTAACITFPGPLYRAGSSNGAKPGKDQGRPLRNSIRSRLRCPSVEGYRILECWLVPIKVFGAGAKD